MSKNNVVQNVTIHNEPFYTDDVHNQVYILTTTENKDVNEPFPSSLMTNPDYRRYLYRLDQGTYVIWIELTVSGQTVQKSLDIRSEDGVKSCIIDFIQMFSKTVPEVKGDLHDLDQNTDPDDNLKIYED